MGKQKHQELITEAKQHDFKSMQLPAGLKGLLGSLLKIAGPLLLDALQKWIDGQRAAQTQGAPE